MKDSVKQLQKYGFLILRNYFSSLECKELQVLSSDLIEEAKNGESTHLLIDERDMSYQELAESPLTILSKRGEIGYDQNLLDFFNPQIWFCAKHSKIHKTLNKFTSGKIPEILNQVHSNLRPKNMNLYVHNNVTTPRIHHIDSIRSYFKVFLALSDQTSNACGPYALIPKSHKKKLFNYLMCSYNRRVLGKKGGQTTDATFYREDQLKPMHLGIGDVLISNQSCVHGALPSQGEGRLTILQTYDIK